jgi:hypothetical protein
MSSPEDRISKQAAVHLAVLDALTYSVHRSTATVDVDTELLADCGGERYELNPDDFSDRDEESSSDSDSGDEERHWREITACGEDPSLPPDAFAHYYDSESEVMYYIEKGYFHGADCEATLSESAVTSFTGNQTSTLKDPDTEMVLSRLKPMHGQFGPLGYIAWMSGQIPTRDSLSGDIPGFASLCAWCRNMLTHSLSFFSTQVSEISRTWSRYRPYHENEIFSHHGTLASLLTSAHAGCHLCCLLLGPGVCRKNTSQCDESQNTRYFLELHDEAGLVWISRYLIDHAAEVLATVDWEEEQNSGPSTLHGVKTNALEVLNLARLWMSRCLEEDGKMCSVATKFLPTRLIEISTKDGTLCSARLVLRNELPPYTPYLTLSHCWGDIEAKPTSLVHDSLGGFRKDIPISDLSKTFRESLEVTTWLGYRHMWIDSLCILQDSDEDWRKEAARMGDIYRHSMCTIVAIGARDGRDGLFFERNSLAFTKLPLAKSKDRRQYVTRYEAWPRPLLDRAWTIQERYLSSRTLYFGSDMISWACRRSEAWESPYARNIQMKDTSFAKLLDGDTDKDTAVAAWNSIVEEYSACKLTFWKDRWPAFQGLTAEVEKAQGWTIVRGLRSHLFCQDLLWVADRIEEDAINSGEPSWSWLNIKSRVFWYRQQTRMHSDARIVSAPIKPLTMAQNLSESALQIEACLIEFKADPQKKGFACSGRLTVKNPNYGQPAQRPAQSIPASWSPDTVKSPFSNTFALQICSEWEGSNMSWYSSMRGLIVSAVPGRPGYWRRVGLYHADACHDYPGHCRGLRNHDDDCAYGSDSESSRAEDSGSTCLNIEEVAAYTRLSPNEASLRGIPCPWNREKTTVYVI